MKKHILKLSTSLRKNSNSEALADTFQRGAVFAGGVNEEGEIKDHPALQEAYEMGKTV
ncbi:hypothetical protein MUB23_09390 [Cuneatibacter sp. NSJ-177]|uniref:hypothetical protein n=1 Tax=Cuneatibacter sp. NSJ-177 TaxID=2931401 RepID=UPI001FD3A2DA|nr:hypothetical protein [Cuneatibacter sp. NSJ-177]MCJ7835605.1 hypothetical protein [Cuneatibacter sp. NSJ-177]